MDSPGQFGDQIGICLCHHAQKASFSQSGGFLFIHDACASVWKVADMAHTATQAAIVVQAFLKMLYESPHDVSPSRYRVAHFAAVLRWQPQISASSASERFGLCWRALIISCSRLANCPWKIGGRFSALLRSARSAWGGARVVIADVCTCSARAPAGAACLPSSRKKPLIKMRNRTNVLLSHVKAIMLIPSWAAAVSIVIDSALERATMLCIWMLT